MAVVVTAADRASFSRRRGPDLDRAVRDALAVYYFPGMWDWDRTVRPPEPPPEGRRRARDIQGNGGSDPGGGMSEAA